MYFNELDSFMYDNQKIQVILDYEYPAIEVSGLAIEFPDSFKRCVQVVKIKTDSFLNNTIVIHGIVHREHISFDSVSMLLNEVVHKLVDKTNLNVWVC